MISDLPKSILYQSILRLLKNSVFYDFRSAEVYPAPVTVFVFYDFISAEVYPVPVTELSVL